MLGETGGKLDDDPTKNIMIRLDTYKRLKKKKENMTDLTWMILRVKNTKVIVRGQEGDAKGY